MSPLVIIDDFNVVRVAILPRKAYAILAIDPNTVLPLSIAGEFFQPVSRGYFQIVNSTRRMDHKQFAVSNVLNVVWKLFGNLPFKNLLRLFALDCLDHEGIIACMSLYVKIER